MNKKKRRLSRLEKAKRKREIRQAILYLSLAIALVTILFIWGIPFLAKLAGLMIKDKDTPQLTNQQTLPLTAPILNNIPEATNSAELEIKGTAESGVEVEIYLNNLKTEKLLTDKNGEFATKIQLQDGENWLYAVAKKGNQIGPKSTNYRILMDKTVPEITILEPSQDKTEFNGAEEQTITISGETNKEIDSAKIGDRIAIIEDGKKFKADYILKQGDNEIEIVVRDRAGNEAKTKLKLKWNP